MNLSRIVIQAIACVLFSLGLLWLLIKGNCISHTIEPMAEKNQTNTNARSTHDLPSFHNSGERRSRDRFLALAEHGFNPLIIYDIGAHRGEWATEIQEIFPTSRLILFEADKDHISFLRERWSEVFCELLGKSSGKEVEFWRNGPCTGNSVFKEQTEHYVSGLPENRITKSLKDVIIEQSLPMPDLLKLDVQGYELEVLLGLEKSIEQIKVIYLEVSLHQYNEGSPLLYEVVKWLGERGFHCFDIGDIHFISGVTGQVDLFFTRKKETMFKKNFY